MSNSLSSRRGWRLARTLLPVAALLSCAAAHGAVIISDTFTAPDSTALPGRAPDTVDVPGGVYAANGGTQFTSDIVGGRANLSVDEGAGVPTGISTPTVYTISDLFNDGNIGGADQADRGEGLGFFTTLSSGNNGFHGDGTFAGITVSPAGLVNLISVTPSQSITTYATPYQIPGYGTTADHTLSYTANTATGYVGNVTVDGTVIPLVETGPLFTPADTVYAGFTASANALGETATYDNFVVAVPEPASVAMLGIVGIGLPGRRRKSV